MHLKTFFPIVALAFCLCQTVQGQDSLHWHSDYKEALDEARKTGKPIFLEFRCVPCINGREFDANVYYTKPDTPRGKLMQQFVLARINTMTGVDIAHFDRDWHNSLYYFIINADEDIYLRYGGRDETSADTYLNLESLELALKAGLEKHKSHKPSKDKSRATKTVPSDYQLIQTEVIEQGRCTECHLIADYSMQEKDLTGLLDPLTDLYRSPDIRNLGLHLDIPKGLVLEKTTGTANEAGIKAGDKISSLNGETVLTFGDLQYQYDKVPRRSAKEVSLVVERDEQEIPFTLKLPFEWWKTDIEFRHWTTAPQIFFDSKSLSIEQKKKIGLSEEDFAAEVTEIDIEAVLSDYHSLEVGDIIVAVNRERKDPLTTDLKAHITIRHPAESVLDLIVLRDGKKLDIPLKTQRLNFRKSPIDKENSPLAVKWSESAPVRYGNDIVITYRATIANSHLIVEARHEHGWKSYSMDNDLRAEHKIGKKGGERELPTIIEIPASLSTTGIWKQTIPTDFSKPDIHWHTFGFEGFTYFALPLSEIPKAPIEIKISSQVCSDRSCAGVKDLAITVPVSSVAAKNIFVRQLLESLDPVLSE